MVKISRKNGITIALMVVLCVGGVATYGKNLKFESINAGIKTGAAICQEVGGVLLHEEALFKLAQAEYQSILGEFYAHHNHYEKSLECYGKAIQGFRESVGDKSFFTASTYYRRGKLEQDHSKVDVPFSAKMQLSDWEKAHDDFKASLEAWPNREEFNLSRCNTEFSLISTTADKIKKENIPFYQHHLALTEKLANALPNHNQHIYALWVLAKSLDASAQYAASEPFWNKMINEARAENYPSVSFETWLYEFANHELYAGHYPETERALWEALRIAAQATDDQMAADILEARADLRLRQSDLVKAENGFQASLCLRKKFRDDVKLGYTYGGLSEVARRRGDLTKREEYLKVAMQLTEAPAEKARTLKSLAIIAAQNNRFQQAKEYVEEWKQLGKTIKPVDTFVFEKDLKNLLHLYPQMDKDFDFSKLQSINTGPHRHGYYLSEPQLTMLMNAIASSKIVDEKK